MVISYDFLLVLKHFLQLGDFISFFKFSLQLREFRVLDSLLQVFYAWLDAPYLGLVGFD